MIFIIIFSLCSCKGNNFEIDNNTIVFPNKGKRLIIHKNLSCSYFFDFPVAVEKINFVSGLPKPHNVYNTGGKCDTFFCITPNDTFEIINDTYPDAASYHMYFITDSLNRMSAPTIGRFPW